MDDQTIILRTRAYIRDTFLYMRSDVQLKDDERLLERGILDSMGVLELIDFIQREFEVAVAGEEITEQNLGTLGSIARLVAAKRGNGNGR